MIKVNEYTNEREFITKGVIKTVSSKVRKLNNDKQTPWQIATAEIVYPNGTTATVGASLFTASLDANPDAFAVGQTAELAIQLDGEYAGNAKLQLPTIAKADVSMLVAAGAAVTNTP